MTAVLAAVTMRDDTLPHQIRLTFIRARLHPGAGATEIAVSCTCLRTGSGNAAGDIYRPLAQRPRWDDPGEPMAIWRAHMAVA